MNVHEKVYLGDSVYAVYDGYAVWLTTENGGPGPSNQICLEPHVFQGLLTYVDKLKTPKIEVNFHEQP